MVVHGAEVATALAKKADAPLTIVSLAGNHHTSLRPAVLQFLARVQQGLAPR